MDRVRFGRALGYGARHAAKTLAEAAKAAATPNAEKRSGIAEAQGTAAPARPRTHSGVADSIRDAGAGVLEAQRAYSQAKQRTATQAASAGRSMLAPVKRAGGVLWLEMTGSVFALFALFLAAGLWNLRAAVHASPSSHEAQKLYLYVLVFAVFLYFAVSSFVRANRRGKRP